MQDAVVGGGFLQRQGEEVGAEEILPEVVVGGWVSEVDIGPDDESFAFWVGGTLQPLEEFEAENGRSFDLGIEGIDEADIGVNGGVTVGGGGDGGYGQDVDFRGAKT